MRRVKNTYGRCPGPGAFSYEELRKATKFYEDRMEENPNKKVTLSDFMSEFQCPELRASMLKSAAIFHYNMKIKGLA